MLEFLVNTDIQLFIFLNNLGNPSWDGFWLFVTNKFSAIPLYILLLFLVYKKLGIKQTLFVIGFGVLLIILSDQTSNLFKYGFKRFRPCHNEDLMGIIRLVKESCGGKYGYFSAHASNSMAIAIYFGLILKPYFKFLFPFLILWAFLVSYSRIYVGVHYPLDVVTGIVFGVFYAILMVEIYHKIIIKNSEKTH